MNIQYLIWTSLIIGALVACPDADEARSGNLQTAGMIPTWSNPNPVSGAGDAQTDASKPVIKSNATLVIGDSILASSKLMNQNMTRYLNELTGDTAQDVSAVGASAQPGTASIFNQYQNAAKDRTYDLVVITGGANDLQGCENYDRSHCPKTRKRIKRSLDKLIADMKQDGVKTIIYLGYYLPYTPQDADVTANIMMNELRNHFARRADVIFVDSRSVFAQNLTRYTSFDGRYPSAEGSLALARLVYDKMPAIQR